jgi:hypothetical protein
MIVKHGTECSIEKNFEKQIRKKITYYRYRMFGVGI